MAFLRHPRYFGAVAGSLAYGLMHSSSGKVASAAAAPSEQKVRACRPIVVCGPSGVGKGTLIEKLLREFPDDYGFSTSHTTRDPRPGLWTQRLERCDMTF